MKRSYLIAVVSMLALSACTTTSVSKTNNSESPSIDKVFFAQQHVLAPDAPLFELVSELEALIKVQVYSETPMESPFVFATLELGSTRTEIRLRGPKMLPKPPQGDPVLMKQSYDDSFTAMIPAKWVKPGLKVAVELRRYDYSRNAKIRGISVLDRREFNTLRIGAPNRIKLTMYDIHYFGRGRGKDYPKDWFNEFQSKLPTAGIDLRRVRDIRFDTVVMPPIGGKPATRWSSPEEYKEKTGHRFDGEQAMALTWNKALRKASGTRNNGFGHTYISIYGVPCGGEAWTFHGVGNGSRAGVLLHEFGHTFHLPDSWNLQSGFPYHGDMHGVKAAWKDSPHVGPAWAFDLHKRVFIPPTVQENAVGGTPGLWKRDPMAGGGQGDQEDTHIFRFFADYSVSRMRDFMHQRAAYWNRQLGAYVRWDPESGTYSKLIDVTYENLPVERDVQVYSILMSISAVTPDANHIYPLIGPYKGNLIPLFDPAIKADREKAAVQFAAHGAVGRVIQCETRVAHSNWKWIGGADRGIAASKAKLAAAATAAEKKAAEEELAKWEKDREAGVKTLRRWQASLDEAMAKGPEFMKANLAGAKKNNVCLKVTQGGKMRTYLLPVRVSPDDNPLSGHSLRHAAINLPARDGAITHMEILHAPDVFTKGITKDSALLYRWKPD